VTSYSLDGGSELLANEIGKFKGQVLLPDQTALLSVEADDAWTGMTVPRTPDAVRERRLGLNERLRSEFIAGAETEWPKRTGPRA